MPLSRELNGWLCPADFFPDRQQQQVQSEPNMQMMTAPPMPMYIHILLDEPEDESR